MKNLTRITAALALAAVVGPQTARADYPDLGAYATPLLFQVQSNTVTIKFLYSLARADNALYLFTSTGTAGTWLMDIPGFGAGPALPGSGDPATVILNGMTPGTFLLFGICTTNTLGNPAGCSSPWTAYYMGPGTNNLDGALHAARLPAATWNGFGVGNMAEPGRWVFGFENKSAGDNPPSDWDYNDVVFSIDGVVIPEPATMVLLATGLIGLSGAGFIRRRRERNRN